MPKKDDRELLELEIADMELEMLNDRPADMYQPGRRETIEGKPIPEEFNGQLQFHQAPHIIRLMAPGNGFGKTASVAVEADWWAQADHPYLTADMDKIRHRKRQILWVATKYQQFIMMRKQMEKWFTPGWEWVGSPWWCYKWTDKAEMYVVTGETNWQTLQGIEPDLIIFDECPPRPLWIEMQRRRRGMIETKFVMSATQTAGLTWMYYDVYLPWLNYHKARGISEEDAMVRQLHRYDQEGLEGIPGIWCWPKGSHRDNPTADAASWAWYLTNTAGSPAERAVRLYGGFRQFAQSPVFDPDALERMRKNLIKGVNGSILEVK